MFFKSSTRALMDRLGPQDPAKGLKSTVWLSTASWNTVPVVSLLSWNENPLTAPSPLHVQFACATPETADQLGSETGAGWGADGTSVGGACGGGAVGVLAGTTTTGVGLGGVPEPPRSALTPRVRSTHEPATRRPAAMRHPQPHPLIFSQSQPIASAMASIPSSALGLGRD